MSQSYEVPLNTDLRRKRGNSFDTKNLNEKVTLNKSHRSAQKFTQLGTPIESKLKSI